jgi:hypothetical protein
VFSDVDVVGVIPNVGELSGTMDFVCGTVHGEGSLGISFYCR